MRRTTIFAAIFMVATPGLADVTPEQKALAEKSALAVTAFECSVLAEKADDRAEQERLFLLGYEEGMALLRAVEAGELTEEALAKHGAWGFTGRLGGPSNDFRLGRIYEGAIDWVYSMVFTDTDDTLQRLQAKAEFDKRNCGLLK